MKKIWNWIWKHPKNTMLVAVIITGLAIILYIFGIPEIWPQLLAIIASAFLGAGATSWISNNLISNQSKMNEVNQKNIKNHEKKIDAYSEFIKAVYEAAEKKDTNNLRVVLFQTIAFYAKQETIKTILTSLDDLFKDPHSIERKQAICIAQIIDALRNDVFVNQNDNEKELLKDLCNVLDSGIKVETDEQSVDKNTETLMYIIPSEDKDLSYNQAWHFAMLGDEQIKALNKGIKELSLVEYGEEWRTNLLKQIRENDIVFLFRRGGYGYIGAFRPKGWRIFEKESNREIIHEFGKKDEEVHNITEENKKKYDIYSGIEDGADLCANLIVEPLYYFPNGGTNPGGVYRRTISRYYSEYADKLMEWFKEKSKLTNKV